MKNRDRWSKQNYTVCGVFAVYCHDDEQREIVRRVATTPEHMEALRCEALLRNEFVGEDLAERFAKAQHAMHHVASRVTDEVLAEARAREDAEDDAAKQKAEAAKA